MSTFETWSARFDHNPADPEACAALKAHYTQQGDGDSVAQLLAAFAAATPDDLAASDAYVELAQWMLQTRPHGLEAEPYYVEALRRDPLSTHALTGLHSLLGAAGEHARLTELLQEHVRAMARVGAPAEQVAYVRFLLGELWGKQFQSADEALHHYRKAVELDPSLIAASYEARQLHLARGELRAASELLEREVAAEPDTARRIALLCELAALYRDAIADLDGAVAALERAHVLAPEDADLAYELASVLAQRAATLDGRTSADENRKVAQLLCDVAAAVDDADALGYLESALDHAPDSDRALEMLETLATSDALRARLPARWVAYLATGVAGEPADRRSVALARAYLREGQTDDAVFCLERAADAGYEPAQALLAQLRPSPAAPEREVEAELQAEPAQAPVPRVPLDLDEPGPAREDVTATTRASDLERLLHASEELRAASEAADAEAPRATEPAAAAPLPAASTFDAVSDEVPLDELSVESDMLPLADAMLEAAGEDSAFVQLRAHAAELARANQLDDAAQAYVEVLEIDPSDLEAFTFLDGHYRRTRAHGERARLLVTSGAYEGAPAARRLAHLREAATLFETRQKDAEGALLAWQHVLAIDPNADDAARALRRLLERSERWDELAALLEHELSNATVDEARATLLRRIATLQREKRNDRPAEAHALERLHALRPDDRAVRDALLAAYLDLGQYAAAADLIDARIEEVKVTTHKLAQLAQLAELYADRLGDADRAYATYERALALAPTDSETLARMIALDERTNNVERLLATLERSTAQLPAAAAAAVYARMASLAERKLDDSDRAADLWTRALDLAPHETSYVDALCALFEREEKHAELAELLRERLVLESDASLRTELYRRLARVLGEHLNDEASAAEAWTKLLERHEDAEALRALEQIARGRDDADALVALLPRLTALETDAELRRDRTYERAELLVQRLGRAAEAVPDLERVLRELDPAYEPAFALLATASEQTGNFGPLAEALERKLAAASTAEERRACAEQLSRIYLERAPNEARLLTALSAWASAAPEQAEPLRLLVPRLTKAKRHEALLGTLDALQALEPDAGTRVDLAIRAAEVAERDLKDDAAAWQRLCTLVAAGAGAAAEPLIALGLRTQQHDALYDVLERAGHVDRLLELLASHAEREADAAVRAALHRRTAQLHIEYRQDERSAADAYKRVVELEHDVDALRFLHAFSLRNDDPALLVSVLDALAAGERDPEERANLVLARAQALRTRLDRARDAVSALVALHSERADVVDELITCCEAAGDDATLATTLERVLAHEHEPSARARLAERIADLAEGSLAQPSRALRALDIWAQAEPHEATPLRRLRPLLTGESRPNELLSVLDRLAQLETTPAARIEATLAGAEVARTQLRDGAAAFDRLASLCAEKHAAADAALAVVARETQRFDDWYALLERAERYEHLVQVLEERVARERDAELRVALLRKIARLRGGALQDEAGATRTWRALLAEREDAEALQLLRTYALGRDDVDEVCDCLTRLAAVEADPTEQRDLLFELGHLLYARKNEAARAVQVLRQVIERDPTFDPALDELAMAAERADDPVVLAEALERLSEREPNAETRIEHLRRLMPLLLAAEAYPRAIAALQRWTQLTPSDPEPHRALASLLEYTGRQPELLAELDVLSQVETSAEARSAAQVKAADLCLHVLRDPEAAFARLEPLASDPAHALGGAVEPLLRELAESHGKLEVLIDLYSRAQRHDDVAVLLREQAERESEPARKAELIRRCARVLAGPCGDTLGAAEAYRDLLRIEEDRDALEFLRVEATREDAPESLEPLLARLAELAPDASTKRDLWLERASLLSERLERPADAIVLLRQVLTLDPACTGAIDELLVIAETEGDFPALADGLERRIALEPAPRVRAELAARLADVYQDALHDTERTVSSLQRWADADPSAIAPVRRLRVLLESSASPESLLRVLDQLATRETENSARAEAMVAASRLCATQLQDAEGALRRLAPLVLARDADGEQEAALLIEQHASVARPLANLFVMRAQRTSEPPRAARDWMAAARIYETRTQEPQEALEAALRALALDLDNRDVLTELERLAIDSRSLDRLARVYARLLQEAKGREPRIELLLRQADLLENRASDPAGALERLLEAYKHDPEQESLLHRADVLAARTQSHAERVWIHEALAQRAHGDEARGRHLLEAARAADLGLRDREQAMQLAVRVLALTEHLPGLAEDLEELVRELDRKRPELGKDDARRGLIRAHLDLAQRVGEPFGPLLMLRASQLLHAELRDDAGCFDALKEAAAQFPDDLDIYDALEQAGVRIGRLDALDAHLARSLQRARDVETKIALLERRGKLLGAHLARPAKAAEVYRELAALKPGDTAVLDHVFTSLHAAGRYQELLRAYRERLDQLSDPHERVVLLRRMAQLWEVELRNRPSAMEVWRQILTLSPNDHEAEATLNRLASRVTVA